MDKIIVLNDESTENDRNQLIKDLNRLWDLYYYTNDEFRDYYFESLSALAKKELKSSNIPLTDNYGKYCIDISINTEITLFRKSFDNCVQIRLLFIKSFHDIANYKTSIDCYFEHFEDRIRILLFICKHIIGTELEFLMQYIGKNLAWIVISYNY